MPLKLLPTSLLPFFLGFLLALAGTTSPASAQTPESEAQGQAADQPVAETPKGQKPQAESTPAAEEKAVPSPLEAVSEKSPLPKPPPPETFVQDPEETCVNGVMLDDGSVEGGYGFIPSLEWGSFVQRFDVPELFGREIEKVCVCFLSDRVDELDFEVVFHQEVGGVPSAEPYARVAGHASDLPNSSKEAGKMFPVAIDGVKLPDGPSYIGVRWDPGKGRRAFVCSSKGTKGNVKTPTLGFQKDSRSTAWENILTTKDFVFAYHQNALIRVVPKAKEATEDGKEGAAGADEAESPSEKGESER